MNTHENKNKSEEKILKAGFEAGVTMAYLSVGKFEKEEENDKLKAMINRLYSEFISIYKHKKDSSDVVGESDTK